MLCAMSAYLLLICWGQELLLLLTICVHLSYEYFWDEEHRRVKV